MRCRYLFVTTVGMVAFSMITHKYTSNEEREGTLQYCTVYQVMLKRLISIVIVTCWTLLIQEETFHCGRITAKLQWEAYTHCIQSFFQILTVGTLHYLSQRRRGLL
jgi:cytochrome bd-type quinol oxidase subunit 2